MKSYQKYAWVLLIPGGLVGLVGFLPPPPSRSIIGPYDFIIGPLLGVMGIVQLVVGPTAFRKGKMWGWYLILLAWLVALVNAVYDLIVAPSLSTGVLTFFTFGGPALLALLLSYRRFYPKKQLAP